MNKIGRTVNGSFCVLLNSSKNKYFFIKEWTTLLLIQHRASRLNIDGKKSKLHGLPTNNATESAAQLTTSLTIFSCFLWVAWCDDAARTKFIPASSCNRRVGNKTLNYMCIMLAVWVVGGGLGWYGFEGGCIISSSQSLSL